MENGQYTLGIDQSLSSTGWAITKDGKLVICGKLGTFPDVIDFCNKNRNPLEREEVFNTWIKDKHRASIEGLIIYDEKKEKVRLIDGKKRTTLFKYEKKFLKVPIETRSAYIAEEILKIILGSGKEIKGIAFEMPSLRSSGQVATLSQLLGFLQGFFYSYLSHNVRGVYPLSLKSFAGVLKNEDKKEKVKKGNEGKIVMWDALPGHIQEKMMELGFETEDDDIIDAIWLSLYMSEKDSCEDK